MINLKQYENFTFLKKVNHTKIFTATHTKTQTKVKIYKTHKLQVYLNNDFGQFISELQISKQLSHENFIHIYRSLEDLHCTYVVCENFEGVPMCDWYLKNGPIRNSNDFEKILFQLISVLSYCHRKRFFHGNLSPKTILIDKHLNIKINWFGFAIPSTKPQKNLQKMKNVNKASLNENQNQNQKQKQKGKENENEKAQENESPKSKSKKKEEPPNLKTGIQFQTNQNKNKCDCACPELKTKMKTNNATNNNLDGDLNPKSDLWSLGFCLYFLIQKSKKEYYQVYKELLQNSNIEELIFPTFVTNDFKNIFSQLLVKDPNNRIDLGELKSLLSIEKEKEKENIDPLLLIEMKKFDLQPESIIEQLFNNRRNETTEIYKLLLKNKKEKENEKEKEKETEKETEKERGKEKNNNQTTKEEIAKIANLISMKKKQIERNKLLKKSDDIILKRQKIFNQKELCCSNQNLMIDLNSSSCSSSASTEVSTPAIDDDDDNKVLNGIDSNSDSVKNKGEKIKKISTTESKIELNDQILDSSNKNINNDNLFLNSNKYTSLGEDLYEESLSSDCLQLLKDIRKEKKKYSNLENEKDLFLGNEKDYLLDYRYSSKEKMDDSNKNDGNTPPPKSKNKATATRSNRKQGTNGPQRKKEMKSKNHNHPRDKDRKGNQKTNKNFEQIDEDEKRKIEIVQKIYQPYLKTVIKNGKNNKKLLLNKFSPVQLSRMRRNSMGNVKSHHTNNNNNKYKIKLRNISDQFNLQRSNTHMEIFEDSTKNNSQRLTYKRNNNPFSLSTKNKVSPFCQSMNYQPTFSYQWNKSCQMPCNHRKDNRNDEENEILNIVELLNSTVSHLSRCKIIQKYYTIFNDLGIKQKKIGRYTIRCQAIFRTETINFELRVFKSKNEKGVNQIHFKRLNCNLWTFYAFWKFINSFIQFK
ncbi:serine/threonine kinase [Anaeramoeba flamelloides]|uniref:Serine/threonine kinase n=1 Tax=Anaeramoeba flamelloides TaxID=1746091 RepID=A0ABQ8Y1F4_9EUKA|nr:serine/threonine kinase [Anaeramoeba flamelloides]